MGLWVVNDTTRGSRMLDVPGTSGVRGIRIRGRFGLGQRERLGDLDRRGDRLVDEGLQGREAQGPEHVPDLARIRADMAPDEVTALLQGVQGGPNVRGVIERHGRPHNIKVPSPSHPHPPVVPAVVKFVRSPTSRNHEQ